MTNIEKEMIKTHYKTVTTESVSHSFLFMNRPVSQNPQIPRLFGQSEFGKLLAIFHLMCHAIFIITNYNICKNWGEKTD